ncbi:sirohydrochlorin chelatase [Thalassobacillus sp. CUG 92003]|uniref:sirohydrochlorin chelatase n=1 Tax=Thalassobacillus sp. CUG 92003 TaxID=2736641 RepID=UPI0015E6AF24|nr:sirohydrochlorin chelatase [Thalassobacillus sp. CUG 92003]
MQAILYVSHGSRVEEARQEAVSFIQSVRRRIDIPLQLTCFLELADPDIEEGVDQLVEQGATHITVMPVLLLSAGHYYNDIPEELEKMKARYPHVPFTLGQPVGVQERVVDILVERVQETGVTLQLDANVLLVGRGSRLPETKVAIEHIASLLQNKLNTPHVDVCYLAACSPSFPDALQTAAAKGASQTFVIPYLWFTGILMESMQEKINQWNTEGQQFILCDYLGDHPAMVEAEIDRVYEALPSSYSRREKV